jgi:hypothetical protein
MNSKLSVFPIVHLLQLGAGLDDSSPEPLTEEEIFAHARRLYIAYKFNDEFRRTIDPLGVLEIDDNTMSTYNPKNIDEAPALRPGQRTTDHRMCDFVSVRSHIIDQVC